MQTRSAKDTEFGFGQLTSLAGVELMAIAE